MTLSWHAEVRLPRQCPKDGAPAQRGSAVPQLIHGLALSIARDTHQSLSQTITGLIRKGLSSGRAGVGIRQVTDAYLAQLARARDSRIATFEQVMAKSYHDVAEAS